MSQTRTVQVLELLKEATGNPQLHFEDIPKKKIKDTEIYAEGKRVYDRNHEHRYYLHIDIIRPEKLASPEETLTVIMRLIHPSVITNMKARCSSMQWLQMRSESRSVQESKGKSFVFPPSRF